MSASKYEYFQGADGQWYFNLIAENGKVVGPSQGYTRKHSCLRGIQAHQWAAINAVEIVETRR